MSKRMLVPLTVRVMGGTGWCSFFDFARSVTSPSKPASEPGGIAAAAAGSPGAAAPGAAEAAPAAAGSLFLLHDTTRHMVERTATVRIFTTRSITEETPAPPIPRSRTGAPRSGLHVGVCV